VDALGHVIGVHIKIIMVQKRRLGEDYAVGPCPPDVPPGSVREFARFGAHMYARHEANQCPFRPAPYIKSEVKFRTRHSHIIIYSEDSVGVGLGERLEPIVQAINFVSVNENLEYQRELHYKTPHEAY
jgi:hypothetical protein